MQLKLNKILIPVDFSEVSYHALRYAIKLAEKGSADIQLLHIVETYKMNVEMLDMEDLDELIEIKAKAKMKELISSLEIPSTIKVETKVRKGKIKREIVNASSDEDIDLIVMGTYGVSGKSPFSKYILGSNAHRVVQASRCPVLTIPSAEFEPVFDDIVLPLDLEKETTLKTNSAIKWAKAFDSVVHLISVVTFFEEYKVDIEDLKKKLKDTAEIIHNEGVEVKIKSIRYADVADAVMDYAEDNNTDLIIIMTRQESKLDQIFLGSRARDVLSKSKIPVLSLRPPMKTT